MSTPAIGTAIRMARASRGWTQRQLAEFAGLHRTYIHKLEAGLLVPGLPNLCKLAEVLGIETWRIVRKAERITAMNEAVELMKANEVAA